MKYELKNKINDLIIYTEAKNIFEKTLFEGNFIKVIQEKYLLPNNIEIVRERIVKNQNKSAVIIIPMTFDGEVLLVSQNRVGSNISIEFPSGYIENGEGVLEAAARELKEETGYAGINLEIIDKYCPMVGIDNSTIYIVVAYGCVKKYVENLSSDEYILYNKFTYTEVQELIDNNLINSGGTKLAFYKLEKLLLQRENEIEEKVMADYNNVIKRLANQESEDIEKTCKYLKTYKL